MTAIIPTWNHADLLRAALESLRGQTCPPGEIIVVDNASTDNSVEVARAAGARIISMPRNRGFACAVNAGIRSAGGHLIAIVNNDVELDARWVELMARELEGGGYGFATGKLFDAAREGILDGAWDEVCRGACAWRCGHGRPDAQVWNRKTKIRAAPFTAVLFRAEVFQQAGLLDESFESYLEDVEFGIRCATKDIEGIYVPDATGRHRGSATYGKWSRDTVRLISRNQVFLVARHFPGRWLLSHGYQVLLAQTLWGFVAMRHGHWFSWLQGKIEGARRYKTLRRIPGAASAQRVQAMLRDGDDAIRRLQKESGFDLFWRIYTLLT